MIKSKYQIQQTEMRGWVEVVECPTIVQARFWERRIKAAGHRVKVKKAAVNDGERGGPRRVFVVYTDSEGFDFFNVPLGDIC